jgi:transcriptional regulator GlxA family with amidase domain
VIREDVGDALRLAASPTLERIRRDRRRVPERFAPLFDCIEEHVLDADFGAEAAWARSGVSRRARFPLEITLASYLEELRVATAGRLLELGSGRLPTGRAALAVGLSGYRTWRAAYRRCTGELPELVRLPERLDPGFDDPTWHHARQGTLSLDDVRFLLSRLWSLGSGTAAAPPGGRALPSVWPPGGGRGEISDAEAREALQRAAAEPRQRLLRDAEGLPTNVVKVLEVLTESLFDPGFSVDGCRRRAEVTETGISTRVCFYFGDTLAVLTEKLRVEVAMRLVGDLRFKIERIAEAVGFSPRHLLRACRRRVGASASEVRKTLQRTAEEPEYRLWCRAGRSALSRADVLALEGFLRGLHPEALAPASALAVRSDVDPSRVADVLDLYRSMPSHGTETSRKLGEVLRTHPRYSAAHWYCHWIRDRLGRGSLDAAWEDWQAANRDLAQLLEQPREQRLELVREVRRFQTDSFLWLLVDCVEARLFHDGVESEHFADLAHV